MADSGQIKALAGGLESAVKKSITAMFEYVLGDIRVGLPGHKKRATNLRWVQLNSTTHAVANTEFTVEHGLGRMPSVIFTGVLDLNAVNTSTPTLTVSRAADGNRLYLKSPSTSVPFTFFIE
jgi:hypothetical protein